MSNSDYWIERFELLEQSQNKQGVETYIEVEKQYRQAQRSIESQISTWYQRFANNNSITLQEAKKLLTSKELEEFKWDVSEYIRYGEENAISGTWAKQLENASARYHISRLESLQIQIQQSVEKAFGNQVDSIDDMARNVYKSGYYHTTYEIQKGTGVGWDLAQLDETKVSKIINKPWAADGKNFSSRIWGNKDKLVNELNTTLTQNIIRGSDPRKAIDEIARKMNVSKSQAGALVMTEQAFFDSASKRDSFNELDVEQYEVVATLDSRTSNICQELDGKVFLMKDYVVGTTAPPFHVRCRTTTCPYFDDEFDFVGERAARDEDGKTYKVPSDMTYKEWEKTFVDDSINVEETQKITEKEDKNAYSVDGKLVNSKEYHDNFENLTSHKAVNESLYQESMKILEHRDGTDLEDLVALDARTGNVITKNTSSTLSGKTGFTQEQYSIFNKNVYDKILLHNHPNSGRFSFTDILTMFNNSDIVGSVAVGHDGTVHMITNPNRDVDIEKLYKKLYTMYKSQLGNEDLAKRYALDELYRRGLFDYERR